MAEQRVQRWLAAIVAADVVGYSRLMEADEAGTLARLKTIQTELVQPKIAEDGGRVVKVRDGGLDVIGRITPTEAKNVSLPTR